MKRIAILLTGLILSSGLWAEEINEQNQRAEIEWLLGMGLTLGGDDLLEAEFTNGTSETLEAGGFIDLKAGIIWNVSQALSLQTTLGYHFDSIDAENGDASFSRMPVDVLGFYNIGSHRIGVGISHHMNSEFEVDMASVGIGEGEVEFDDAQGVVVEYGYRTSDRAILGIRYVSIDYEADTVDGVKVTNPNEIDGGHIGGYLYITF